MMKTRPREFRTWAKKNKKRVRETKKKRDCRRTILFRLKKKKGGKRGIGNHTNIFEKQEQSPGPPTIKCRKKYPPSTPFDSFYIFYASEHLNPRGGGVSCQVSQYTVGNCHVSP